MIRGSLLILFFLNILQAEASPPAGAYFTIDTSSVEITEIAAGELSKTEVKQRIGECSEDLKASPAKPTDGAKGIINYGKIIWQIVKENRPVVNVKEANANALPRGVDCWTDLEEWQVPKYKTYQVSYENLMGIEIVSFTFQLFYSYGAHFKNKGQYLANVTVTPMNIDVLWGFKFNAAVEVGTILNMGSKENPLAGMDLAMKWSVSSPLQESRSQVRYFVQGDGTTQTFD